MVKLKFYGTEKSETHQTSIEVFATERDEILIYTEGNTCEYVCLDKATAIKLVKTLKSEISKIEQI